MEVYIEKYFVDKFSKQNIYSVNRQIKFLYHGLFHVIFSSWIINGVNIDLIFTSLIIHEVNMFINNDHMTRMARRDWSDLSVRGIITTILLFV